MISVLKHETTQRSYEEDTAGEDFFGNVVASEVLSLKLKSSSSWVANQLLYISCEPATVLGSSVIADLGLERIGDIVDSQGKIYSGIFGSSTSDLTVVVQQMEVPEDLFSQFSNLLTETEPKFVTTLGFLKESSMASSQAQGSSLHGMLKKLTTTAFSKSTEMHLVESVGDLECGNVVTGVPASILNYCEVRSIPSVLLLSITKSALTVPTMKAFEGAIPLCSHMANAKIKQPDVKSYSALERRDPFLFKTQTLYC